MSEFQRLQPLMNLTAERACGDASEAVRADFEAAQRPSQKRRGSRGISSIEVVERRRRLNQRLEKALFRLLQCKPDAFPMLMGEEKFRVPVAAQALGERAGCPIKRHDFSISGFSLCAGLEPGYNGLCPPGTSIKNNSGR